MSIMLKNDRITAELEPLGAELRSLKTSDGTEYLWQGDVKYWTGRATNLFPIVGRLTEGKYTYGGAEYVMGIHGFARHSVFEVTDKSADSVTFSISESPETLKAFPFPFRFSVRYELKDDTLGCRYIVENTGGGDLIFTVGGHPGFNVPLDGGKFEDWYLDFGDGAKASEIVMSPACFITDESRPFPLPDGRIDLRHSLFDNDAIVLSGMPKRVTLKSNKSARFVTVRYDGMDYLGLWHKPRTDAPYICIEPWSGLPSYDGVMDDLSRKRDMTKLGSGKTYENGFSITVG